MKPLTNLHLLVRLQPVRSSPIVGLFTMIAVTLRAHKVIASQL